MSLNSCADIPAGRELATKFGLDGVIKEMGTAARATGDVYVITGPVYEPNISQSPSIGPGKVRVPKYIFKLVYDQDTNRAWVHWHLNNDATRGSKPISYTELVKRTGIEFLPDVSLSE